MELCVPLFCHKRLLKNWLPLASGFRVCGRAGYVESFALWKEILSVCYRKLSLAHGMSC